MPAIIPFVKFGAKPQELATAQAKKVNDKLNESLLNRIIAKAPDEKKALLKEKLKTASINLTLIKDKPLAAVIDGLANTKFSNDDAVKNLLLGIAATLDRGEANVGSLLGLDLPLKDNPVLKQEYFKAKATAFGELAGLSAAAVNTLAEQDRDVDDMDNLFFQGLVSSNVLKPAQAKKLELVINISRLSGENFDLIKALTDSNASMESLIDFNAEDWKMIISSKRIPLPREEKSAETYAATLARGIEHSFPQLFFLNRIILKKNVDEGVRTINSFAKVKKMGAIHFSGSTFSMDKINWRDTNAAEKKKLEADMASLQQLLHQYRFMGIAEIVADDSINTNQQENSIKERLAQLKKFYEKNKDKDFSNHDFFDAASKLDYTGISEENKPRVRAQAMANQRMLSLGGNTAAAITLLSKGFSSSFDIVNAGEETFTKISGFEMNEAKSIFTAAHTAAAASSHFLQAVRDSQRGGFTALAVNNMPGLVNDLRQINGYSEIFGSQDYCECDHCKSIFSPAAYFTDLMLFVEKNVTKRFFSSQPGHPLHLRTRRPDLWKLPFTCQNTTTEIPYLDVVNDVLEQFIQQGLAGNNVYEELATSEISCSLPFHLPLQELRLYLSHFELTLAQVYKMLYMPGHKLAQEKLLLSDKELEIITTPDTVKALRRFGNPANLNDFPIADFIHFAGISREQLDALLSVVSVPSIAAVKIIVTESTNDIQQFHECFKTGTLTAARLDTAHRFLKLWAKTPWAIQDLDRVLVALNKAGAFTALENTGADGQFEILKLAEVIAIQNALKLSVEELCAVIDEIPGSAFAAGQRPMYERIFSLQEIFGTNSATGVFNTEVELTNNRAADKITPHLLAGLSISEQELNKLFGLLGIDNLAAPVGLNKNILSRLYRQARLAAALKLSIDEFMAAVRICTGSNEIINLQQISMLIGSRQWLETTPFTFQNLGFILFGTEGIADKYQYNSEKLQAIVAEIRAASGTDDSNHIFLLKEKLQQEFNIAQEQLINIYLPLIPVNIESAEIKVVFTEDVTAHPEVLQPVVSLFNLLEKKIACFKKLQWNAGHVSFVVANAERFGITDNANWGFNHIKAFMLYTNLLNTVEEQNKATLEKVISSTSGAASLTAGNIESLSAGWQCTPATISSLTGIIPSSLTVIEGLHELYGLLQLCRLLGVQGDSLIKLTGNSFEALTNAAHIVFGSFASKYADEKTRVEKLVPYHDKLNTLKRDALCSYIIAQSNTFKFKERSDLYHFFLLDVEMSGCFRTSKMLAAISSLQLYIHRCLMGLEQSDPNLNTGIDNITVANNAIPAAEWEWRKNYRVWEANRKVFLYPENYIDPSLRDNKTWLFKELEDELLQQKITTGPAEAAYKKYLAQFLELSHLRYAGAYYHHVDNNPVHAVEVGVPGTVGMVMVRMTGGRHVPFKQRFVDQDKTAYYIFAHTYLQPRQYYYRTYHPYTGIWGQWQKMDLPVEADEVSAIMHNGKLYVYWTDVQHKEITNIKEGTASSGSVVFKISVKYSHLDANGKWAAPQKLFIGNETRSNQQIADRLQAGLDEINGDKKDALIEKFKQEVFRKPYVLRTGNNEKLNIKHIYSLGKGVQNVVYYTRELKIISGDFSIPPHQFIVTNNRFGASQSGNFAGGIRYKITLESAASATIAFKIPGGLTLHFNTGVDFGLERLEEVWLTNGTQDIYKNNTPPNRVFHTHLTSDFIENTRFTGEYLNAFDPEGHFIHFVETGDSDFVSKNKLITQKINGNAHLEIIKPGDTETIPLSTILSEQLNARLEEKGLAVFLSLATQNMNDSAGQQFDFNGPYGAYYWEMFFHIPFVIASHLNANQDFKGAKWWYERIFDPASPEQPAAGENAGEHYWRFREFRGIGLEKLQDILSDNSAIAVYKKDPFDPHAIARLRISAYQKAIVMKYIDNLLDWGDYLFTKDTQESIVEAEMLYQMAQDILGKRPVKAGKCKTAADNELTFETVAAGIQNSSEFLLNVESLYNTAQRLYYNDKSLLAVSKYLSSLSGGTLLNSEGDSPSLSAFAGFFNARRMSQLIATPSSGSNISSAGKKVKLVKYAAIKELSNNAFISTLQLPGIIDKDVIKIPELSTISPAVEIATHGRLAFFAPVNEDLLHYWDRVQDRLFKIRNCMNISGIRRSLALFQPPIDPMLLVRAAAAGIAIDDMMAMEGGAAALPNYRFSYMLEKAKQFAQNVQSFGAALLSAIEKKDGEELVLLRSVHERNILRLTKEIKKKQVDESVKQFKALEETIRNIENRIDYYQGLIEVGLTIAEHTQRIAKYSSMSLQTTASIFYGSSSLLALVPQLGSPFSINYGGEQVSKNAINWGATLNTVASILDSISTGAGMEAGFQRRDEEWRFQLKTAKQDLTQTTQQLLAAEIRLRIAEKDLEVHEKTMEHADEIDGFYRSKFTSFSLYNYMSVTLHRLYRLSFIAALDMAKAAERCYKEEVFDETTFIENDNWQNERAGLLAGERLAIQLNRMEQSYMDLHKRSPEITQNFSLALMDPAQLLQLKQTGKCTIRIPEIAFDMIYPGQYRRLIRGVRVSIPCIAGPYTNIGASLQLTKAQIRKEYSDEILTDKLLGIVEMTTSTAMGDSGTFEFNFRDERYLPFEYCGAISEWELGLPSQVRSFNYNTISDVILQISYTSVQGDRVAAENKMLDALRSHAANEGLFKLISMKNDFSGEFHQLRSGVSNTTAFTLSANHFPYFLMGKNITITDLLVYVKPLKNALVQELVSVKINDSAVINWDDSFSIPIHEAGVESKIIAGKPGINGSPLRSWKIEARSEPGSVDDIMILFRYKLVND